MTPRLRLISIFRSIAFPIYSVSQFTIILFVFVTMTFIAKYFISAVFYRHGQIIFLYSALGTFVGLYVPCIYSSYSSLLFEKQTVDEYYISQTIDKYFHFEKHAITANSTVFKPSFKTLSDYFKCYDFYEIVINSTDNTVEIIAPLFINKFLNRKMAEYLSP